MTCTDKRSSLCMTLMTHHGHHSNRARTSYVSCNTAIHDKDK